MSPVTHGELRRQEIVAAYDGPIVAGSVKALSPADMDALIQRAVATYFQRLQQRIGNPTELQLRAYAREILEDADHRGCIHNGTGATAFIVFASVLTPKSLTNEPGSLLRKIFSSNPIYPWPSSSSDRAWQTSCSSSYNYRLPRSVLSRFGEHRVAVLYSKVPRTSVLPGLAMIHPQA